MYRKLIAAAALAALYAMPGASAAERCAAAVDSTWKEAGISVEVFTNGPSCDKAWAVLGMRNAAGEPVYWQAYATDQNAALAGQTDVAGMEKALKDWIDPTNATFKTTADLPEWKEGADFPMSGEFPFYPDEGIDRENYKRIQALKAPIFCFVSGMESMTCLYPDKDSGGMLFTVGVQSFPG